MPSVIVILATADTKGAEIEFLRARIEALGGSVRIMDFGVMADPQIAVDISARQVAEAAGVDLQELRQGRKRDEASAVMSRGMTRLLRDAVTEGNVQGLIGLGGTQGTAVVAEVLRSLPYGLPKIVVSTMASGDTSGYVGIRDITMMFSVSDILGLNPFLRNVLNNAAGAVVGMADAGAGMRFETDRPVIGMTNLGVLTKGTMYAIERLNEMGFEVIVFHAVGSGGAAMEAMMRERLINAVFDYAMGELTDRMFDGVRACDEARFSVASALGLPQVIVPGGVDHIGVLVDRPNTVPAKYQDRKLAWHNPVILVPRTSADEARQMMAELRRRLGEARHCSILLPMEGVSAYSVSGGELRDAEADRALFEAAHREFDGLVPVLEVAAGAEDAAFIDAAIGTLREHIEQAG